MSSTRVWPAAAAEDELRLLTDFLTFLRLTAVSKVEGLSRELAAATPIPTSPVVSALGVLKHLTAVERWWLSIEAGGVELPSLWGADADASWQLHDEDTVDSVIAEYRAEWELSDKALAGLAPGDRTRGDHDGKGRTVRWVLAHLVQETGRHVGHLDFLRELADGEKGE
ncbi:putative damage-inducible protein DinB [Saccharothrix tamanrassetensis]|uniref:Putative damage-inducible protein DinB n=1 Tax=Saccharothrix tamanrassetensis TaxID=1051531 RepID=A0A841CBP1_9PSEU|nr:DinB family protein [Saccharothrix tamanrassetensis]MBB5955932.1 putative damage-inducible protein DinB [Saccharothrix tamanrassetensis]